MLGVRGLGTDVDMVSSNPNALVVLDWTTGVFADAGTWREGVDSSGGNVGLESSGATERDFPFFVAADCVFLDVVTRGGDITGWKGGVASGIDSERTTPAGA